MKAVFPDTCVFIDFACVGRLDILQFVIKANGHWSTSVQAEVTASEAYYPSLAAVSDFMPAPLVPTIVELQHALLLKGTFFDEAGDSRSAHLGECELIAVAESRFSGDSVMVLTRDKKLIA